MESGDESEEEEVRIRREGEETLNARLSPNTQYKYKKSVEKWVQLMRNLYPDLWIEEENGGGHIDLDNVSTEQLKHFFAYIKTKRNRDGTAKISEDTRTWRR